MNGLWRGLVAVGKSSGVGRKAGGAADDSVAWVPNASGGVPKVKNGKNGSIGHASVRCGVAAVVSVSESSYQLARSGACGSSVLLMSKYCGVSILGVPGLEERGVLA